MERILLSPTFSLERTTILNVKKAARFRSQKIKYWKQMSRLLIIIFIISVSCQNKDIDYCHRHVPFLATDLSNYKRSWAEECQSFEKVYGVDMEIYQKSQGDTLIQLTYSGLGNDSLYFISYWVPMTSTDSLSVQNFLSTYGTGIYTLFSREKQFGIYSYRKHKLFKGRISNNYLIISSPVSFSKR